MAASDPIHYVITVHGMGESRKYETSLSVISRFAEAAAAEKAKTEKTKAEKKEITRDRDLVTLGMVGHQMERKEYPWATFEGIGLFEDNKANISKSYTGLPPKDTQSPSTYVRFVDLWWADLLAEKATAWMQPSRAWSESLLGRLEHLPKELYENPFLAKPPRWIMQLLYEVSELLVPVETYLGFTNKKARELIFTKFLGDVQLYAEYPPMRGLAVRRFHERMAQLHEAHLAELGNRPACYTILAHSLGSIMALDALLYAHAHEDIRADRCKDLNIRYFPFDGYLTNATAPVPNTDWIKDVRTFVTLGSPIDKYLQIWKHNYEYLYAPEVWVDQDLVKEKITHLNYCEEQDPVGHNLDQWRKTSAFQELFHERGTSPLSSRDTVYRRHAMPGVAHVSYWKDRGLFKHIWKYAIAHPEAAQGQQPSRQDRLPHNKGTYLWIILLSYLVIPFMSILLAHFSFMGALNASSWQTIAISTAIFVGVCWVDRKLLNLIIWWRQIVRNKLKKDGKDINNPVFVPDRAYPFGQWFVRLGLPLLALAHVYLALYYLGTYFSDIQAAAAQCPPALSFLCGLWVTPAAKPQAAFFMWLALWLFILFVYQLKSGNYWRMVKSQRTSLATAFTADAVTVVLSVAVVWGAWQGQLILVCNVLMAIMGICALIWIIWSIPKKGSFSVIDWFAALLVLIVASGIGLGITHKNFHCLIEHLDFSHRTFGVYNFIAMIIWTYTTARFFIAKAQLAD